MKINEISTWLAGQEAKRVKDSQESGKNDFAQLLKNEMTGPGHDISLNDAIGGPASPLGIWETPAPMSDSSQQSGVPQAVSAIEGVLTQLDSLMTALQQTASPKEIDNLIQQINTQAAGLDDKMSGLPADHQLRNVAEELKVAAYMESVKWKRGDYL